MLLYEMLNKDANPIFFFVSLFIRLIQIKLVGKYAALKR